MKEIDPEVAALLDNLPPTKLPEVLVEKGWGQATMADAQRHSVWNKTVKPSTTFQPTFEPCVQCGRPVAMQREMWVDHAGSRVCDGALVDDQFTAYHITESELEQDRKLKAAYPQEYMLLRGIEPKPVPTGPCASSKFSLSCAHQCSQKGEHFGFHECKFCKHLWS